MAPVPEAADPRALPADATDAALMARAAAGDRAAWRSLYVRHERFVFRVAFRFLGDEAEASDVVQDVFVNLFRRAGSYRPAARFSTWLFQVVANRCLNERARTATRLRAGEAQPAPGELEAVAADGERRPDRELESREVQESVRAALLELPERQRLALVLARFEGLSYEEIAAALSCSVSSVESLLFRGRQNLAKRLVDGP